MTYEMAYLIADLSWLRHEYQALITQKRDFFAWETTRTVDIRHAYDQKMQECSVRHLVLSVKVILTSNN